MECIEAWVWRCISYGYLGVGVSKRASAASLACMNAG